MLSKMNKETIKTLKTQIEALNKLVKDIESLV